MPAVGIFPWGIAMSTKTKCGFGIAHYEEILSTGIEKGYRFIRFDELSKQAAGQKLCVLRHDVDYLPERNLRFAEIENRLGIRAAYFFQIGAMPYNLREAKNYRVVRELSKMGHVIGLHFDFTWKENVRWDELAALCKGDKKVFQAITGITPCEIISFHNPHRFTERILNQKIAGMCHTYEADYFSSIKYISDSQGWYEGCMCGLFRSAKYPAYQFLTHDYIWPDRSSGDFITDMAHMIKGRGNELLRYMIEFHPVCRKHQDRLRKELAHLRTQ